jgi:hypothetical protein
MNQYLYSKSSFILIFSVIYDQIFPSGDIFIVTAIYSAQQGLHSDHSEQTGQGTHFVNCTVFQALLCMVFIK